MVSVVATNWCCAVCLCLPPSPIDVIWAGMIVWRIRRKIIRRLSELFSAVLCTTIVHSQMHTQMSSCYRCTRTCWFRFRCLVWGCLCVFLPRTSLFCFVFVFFVCIFSCLFRVVDTSASDCPERLVSEMAHYCRAAQAERKTLLAHSLTVVLSTVI